MCAYPSEGDRVGNGLRYLLGHVLLLRNVVHHVVHLGQRRQLVVDHRERAKLQLQLLLVIVHLEHQLLLVIVHLEQQFQLVDMHLKQL